MNEKLEQACHDIRFTVDDLRAALAGADALEALVLLRLIAEAADLQNQIIAFHEARHAR